MLPANGRGASDSGLWPARRAELEALHADHAGLGPVFAAKRAMTTMVNLPMLASRVACRG